MGQFYCRTYPLDFLDFEYLLCVFARYISNLAVKLLSGSVKLQVLCAGFPGFFDFSGLWLIRFRRALNSCMYLHTELKLK